MKFDYLTLFAVCAIIATFVFVFQQEKKRKDLTDESDDFILCVIRLSNDDSSEERMNYVKEFCKREANGLDRASDQ